MRAFAIDAVAKVSIFAGRALVLAVLPEIARCTHLVTLGAIPAPITGDTATLRHLTWLLSFAVTAPEKAAILLSVGGRKEVSSSVCRCFFFPMARCHTEIKNNGVHNMNSFVLGS